MLLWTSQKPAYPYVYLRLFYLSRVIPPTSLSSPPVHAHRMHNVSEILLAGYPKMPCVPQSYWKASVMYVTSLLEFLR